MLVLNQQKHHQEITLSQTSVQTMMLLILKLTYQLQNKSWVMSGRKQLSKKPNNHQETILCPILDKIEMSEQHLLVFNKERGNITINGMLLKSQQHHLQEIIKSLILVKTTTLEIQGTTLQVPKRDLEHGPWIDSQRILFSLQLMLMKEKDLTQFAPQLAAPNTSKRKLVWDILLTIQFPTLVEIEI